MVGTHYGTQIGTQNGTQMPPISLRYTPPYKLHLRKGKYYVSVVAPDELKHLYADGRSRRSTGTNDQRIAHERASQIISLILDDFDAKKNTA